MVEPINEAANVASATRTSCARWVAEVDTISARSYVATIDTVAATNSFKTVMQPAIWKRQRAIFRGAPPLGFII
jgi:hypothetical protein